MHLLEVDLVVEIEVDLVERSVEEAFEEHAAAHGDIDEKADGENGGHASGDEDDVGLVDVAFEESVTWVGSSEFFELWFVPEVLVL